MSLYFNSLNMKQKFVTKNKGGTGSRRRSGFLKLEQLPEEAEELAW